MYGGKSLDWGGYVVSEFRVVMVGWLVCLFGWLVVLTKQQKSKKLGKKNYWTSSSFLKMLFLEEPSSILRLYSGESQVFKP